MGGWIRGRLTGRGRESEAGWTNERLGMTGKQTGVTLLDESVGEIAKVCWGCQEYGRIYLMASLLMSRSVDCS